MSKISSHVGSPVKSAPSRSATQGLMKGKPCVQKTRCPKIEDAFKDKMTRSEELKECGKDKDKKCDKPEKGKEADDKESLEKKIAELEKQIQDMQKERKAEKGSCSGGGGEKGGGGSCGGAKGAEGAKDKEEPTPDQLLSQLADAALKERTGGQQNLPGNSPVGSSKDRGASAINGPATQKLRQAAEKYRNDPDAPISPETKRKVNHALGQQFFHLDKQPRQPQQQQQAA